MPEPASKGLKQVNHMKLDETSNSSLHSYNNKKADTTVSHMHNDNDKDLLMCNHTHTYTCHTHTH